MKRYRTKGDIVMPFRVYGDVTIPAGTKCSPVTPYPTQTRPQFWIDDFGWIEKVTGFKDSMLKHDAVHYGIWLEADQVEEVPHGSD